MRARIWINKTKLASQQGASNSDQVRWERPEVVLNQLMLPHGEGARQKSPSWNTYDGTGVVYGCVMTLQYTKTQARLLSLSLS